MEVKLRLPTSVHDVSFQACPGVGQMSSCDGGPQRRTLSPMARRPASSAPTSRLASGPGPKPQWSADGQWWWDGHRWTQMWEAPKGLGWDGATWVKEESTHPGETAVADPPPAPTPVVARPIERPEPPAPAPAKA